MMHERMGNAYTDARLRPLVEAGVIEPDAVKSTWVDPLESAALLHQRMLMLDHARASLAAFAVELELELGDRKLRAQWHQIGAEAAALAHYLELMVRPTSHVCWLGNPQSVEEVIERLRASGVMREGERMPSAGELGRALNHLESLVGQCHQMLERVMDLAMSCGPIDVAEADERFCEWAGEAQALHSLLEARAARRRAGQVPATGASAPKAAVRH